jgi:hypothetical protein
MSDETVFKQFRIKKKLLKLFNEKCKKKSLNGSEWLRQQIEIFTKEDKK